MTNYYILLAFQALIISFFVVFAFHRYFLLNWYIKSRSSIKYKWPKNRPLPNITVQVPIYNEYNVAARVIDAVSKLTYPLDKLDVQILDDSTDETAEIVVNAVRKLRTKGFPISRIHRKTRKGFKAGALEAGLKLAKGEYIAIFDADFVPSKDSLYKLIAPFIDDSVGVSQARWGHINRNFSLLTKLQAILLDGHFVIEQSARNRTGRFMNFNGTAGMWRKQAIINSGGWSHDTLTEDMDLSYRSQLKGWKFVYLSNVVCPAELPVSINAFKNQQHRWAKGSVETGIKLGKKILFSKEPIKVKHEAIVHLFANICYPINILITLMWLPSIIIGAHYHIVFNYWVGLILFFIATLPFIIFYMFAQREVSANWFKQIFLMPFMLALGIGLTVNSGIAVLEALFGKKSEFKRTPKYGVVRQGESWVGLRYGLVKGKTIALEVLLSVYLVLTIYFTIRLGVWSALPFVCMFFFSFSYVSFLSIRESFRS